MPLCNIPQLFYYFELFLLSNCAAEYSGYFSKLLIIFDYFFLDMENMKFQLQFSNGNSLFVCLFLWIHLIFVVCDYSNNMDGQIQVNSDLLYFQYNLLWHNEMKYIIKLYILFRKSSFYDILSVNYVWQQDTRKFDPNLPEKANIINN